MDGKRRKVVDDGLDGCQCVIREFVLDHRLENSLTRIACFRASVRATLRGAKCLELFPQASCFLDRIVILDNVACQLAIYLTKILLRTFLESKPRTVRTKRTKQNSIILTW